MFQLMDIDFILKLRSISLQTFSPTLQLGLQDQTLSHEKTLWTVKHWKVKVWQIKIDLPNSAMFFTANISHYTVYDWLNKFYMAAVVGIVSGCDLASV